MPDHPHTRGENANMREPELSNAGPSPHAWGERDGNLFHFVNLRTIPTRVGRTTPPGSSTTVETDHPHTRGENAPNVPSSRRMYGPSPHAWGERHELRHIRICERTIPTRVGRTEGEWPSSRCYPDHPHTRGENPGRLYLRLRDTGPSPHAWGELISVRPLANRLRTIPTRVGRTESGSEI